MSKKEWIKGLIDKMNKEEYRYIVEGYCEHFLTDAKLRSWPVYTTAEDIKMLRMTLELLYLSNRDSFVEQIIVDSVISDMLLDNAKRKGEPELK